MSNPPYVITKFNRMHEKMSKVKAFVYGTSQTTIKTTMNKTYSFGNMLGQNRIKEQSFEKLIDFMCMDVIMNLHDPLQLITCVTSIFSSKELGIFF